MGYSSVAVYVVIVVVTLAEELLALPTLLVTSLLGVPVSAIEMAASPLHFNFLLNQLYPLTKLK
jgi:tetrahydromethanopterin S-methyltransferase subunit E